MVTKAKVEENGAVTPEAMTARQALNVLAQAAYQYKGNRQEHVLIDQALALLDKQVGE